MNNEQTASTDRSAVDVSLLLLRIIVGVIFAAARVRRSCWEHSAGMAFRQRSKRWAEGRYLISLPIGEFFGGWGSSFGFLTRFSAASLIVIMIGAIAMVHGKNGFFQSTGGFEYNLALIGLLLPIFLCGPGRFSIGRLFMPKSAKTGRPVVVLE